MTITSYSLLNFEEISKDVAARSKIMTDYRNIIDRRIKIEQDYFTKMKQLANLPQMKKIPNATKATEFIYNSLINAMNLELENLSCHVKKLDSQIVSTFIPSLCELEINSKKQLTSAAAIIKEYEKRYEELEKQKHRMLKKSYQLKKYKLQYIVGTIIDMPFDKKNKLFIKTKEMESGYYPLITEVNKSVIMFNDKTQQWVNKLEQNLAKIETTEEEKVQKMKKMFIAFKMSKSEYGKNLVEEEDKILSGVNQLQAANPEFLRCPIEKIEECKKELMAQVNDPCSYINNLFTNIIDTNNIHEMFSYGKEEKHMEVIKKFIEVTSQKKDEDSTSQQQNFIAAKEFISCFASLFNSETEDQNKLKKLEELIQKYPKNRRNLILCLQHYRTQGIFSISEKNLPNITNILNIFLNSCMNHMDTYNSKFLLVLSMTYYIINGNEKKMLFEYIKNHTIWKKIQWWECALLQSAYSEIKIIKRKQNRNQGDPITIWHIKGSAGYKHSQRQNEQTIQQTVLSQIHFYITNMRQLKIKEQWITGFAKKFSKCFQVSQQGLKTIQQDLLKVKETDEEGDFDCIYKNGSPSAFKKNIRKVF